jgi:hypothetical protein
VIDTMLARWRGLLPDQRRWLVINAVVGTAAINLVLNAALARISVGDHASVPLWALPKLGHPSTAIDTFGTLLFLPLGTSLGITRAVRLARDKGHLRPLPPAHLGPWLRRLPAGRATRGAVVGVICFLALSPVALAVFALDGVGDLSRGSYVLYRVVLCVLLGAVVSPLIALAAMAEPSPRPLRAAIA